MKNLFFIAFSLLFLAACKSNKNQKQEVDMTPTVSADGSKITFKSEQTIAFFKTKKVNDSSIVADLTAPGKIAATVVNTRANGQNIILFEDPELAGSYSQFIQHQINIRQIQNVNIKQKQIELNRIMDLQKHGAATGQELLNVQSALSMEQTNLENEKAALAEHEAKLMAAGFDRASLKKAGAGKGFIICDIPENQITKIKSGQSCKIEFDAYPGQSFEGRVDDIADMVDNTTRMIKVRISFANKEGKFKSGMFTNVFFGISEGRFISVENSSLVTVQGKQYVFLKKNKLEFDREPVQVGQQLGEKTVILSGLKNGDEIAVDGVMQLKGLSFGY